MDVFSAFWKEVFSRLAPSNEKNLSSSDVDGHCSTTYDEGVGEVEAYIRRSHPSWVSSEGYYHQVYKDVT